ncbi:EAL domain-containing protein [Solwaraspora sp. WMMD1047]|uniref:putative bifunctional diguanylate cyclase/phosphodiesterase n=1 Tax=Solwaraspora sp. WMMD1047 TaxID=3016102 RepID=UPI00241624A8|nr:EAL domain-containing protein [Solwaraspora sp. WMMD1047]MDG4833225.1 EAL domain-containing protein [Solwaraspora sp. WMMD1047]
MSVRRVMAGYTAGMTVLIGCFYAAPGQRVPVTAAIGLLSVAALGYGIRRHRPHRGYAWWLLAAGVLAFSIGDVLYLAVVAGSADQYDSAAGSASDVFYLLMFPLIGAGLLGLTRANAGARDRSGLLDFLVFSTAALFLLWVFLIHPFVVTPGPASFERSALSAYTLADALVVAATVRLLLTDRRNPAAMLLVAGATGMLAADLTYSVAVLNDYWQAGGVVELGWFLFYFGWSAAALHPGMAALTERADPPQREVGRTRLVLLGFAALLAPAVLLLQALLGDVRDGAVIAVASGISFVLVLHRLSDAADAHRVAVARERTLRVAGAALVAARDAREVERATRTAIGQLLPGTPHRVVFSVNRTAGVPAAATSIWGPAVAAPSAYYPPPTVAAARRTRLLRVGTLQPALAEQLRAFESAMLCPLVLDERATGVPRVGALLVGADPKVLRPMRDSLEVLAAQVALTLERISLNEEISRRVSEEYFRSLVQHTADVILIVGDDHRIRYASPSVAAVLGVEPADCGDLPSVVHPDDVPGLRALLTAELPLAGAGAAERSVAGVLAADVLAAGPPGSGGGQWREWSPRRCDGTRVHLEVSCRDLRRDRAVGGFVLTMRDVTERRRLQRELSHQAVRDALTGLANRASYQDQVHEAVQRARVGGGTVGALSIDLDEFTTINDSHGQAVGDALLVAAGQRLCELVGGEPDDPDGAVVARLGGDEFAVLVPTAAGPEQVERIAERIVTAFAEPLTVTVDATGSAGVAGSADAVDPVDEVLITGSVSVGVATSADATGAGELLQRADLALYVAKRAGKGRWCRYESELHAAIIERLELRTALVDAVRRLSFTVEYQPIVDLRLGTAVGFEALVRWQHPARGAVPPEQFIALAEEAGLIEPLGEWVLREALAAAARWQSAAGNGAAPYVSVNVSARQLRIAGFVAKVRAAIDDAGLPPARVMLEITESLLLRDQEPVWAELNELRALGLRVAIDDFGTGFSSLSYLQQTPADVIKLDRSFAETVATSRRQRLLVEGVLRLAATLGLEIIAEGVETEVERAVLMDMGCAYAQGYLFSRPVREPELASWLPDQRQPEPIARLRG